MGVTYGYDPAGNRSWQRDDVSGARTTYAHDGANQLNLERSGSARVTYLYDGAGNRAQKQASSDVTYYAWDARNRLAYAEPVAGRVTFGYNGTGRRVAKQTGGDTTRYVWDFRRLLQEADGAGATEHQYLSSDQEFGDLVSGYGSGQTKYYEFDALGSTEILLDGSGGTTDRYQYTAFGLAAHTTGSDTQPLTWVGKLNYQADSEIGLYYLGAGGDGRAYDPSSARFLSKDRLEERGGSPNLYLYCANDPVNSTDPSGQHPEDRLRPGSRISNLLVHDDQVSEVTKRLSDALGAPVQTVPGPPKSGYTYIVLPPEALNEAGHAKIVAALASYQLSNKDVQDNLADVLRAIYRGNITNPPGYTDRYLVTDPLTGKGYVSTMADFGSSLISGDLSKVSPAVPGRIVIAVFPELRPYGFGRVPGPIPELW